MVGRPGCIFGGERCDGFGIEVMREKKKPPQPELVDIYILDMVWSSMGVLREFPLQSVEYNDVKVSW